MGINGFLLVSLIYKISPAMIILASASFLGIKLKLTPLSISQAGSTAWNTGFPEYFMHFMSIIVSLNDRLEFLGFIIQQDVLGDFPACAGLLWPRMLPVLQLLIHTFAYCVLRWWMKWLESNLVCCQLERPSCWSCTVLQLYVSWIGLT